MIPKIIYFTWISDKPIPTKYEKYIESWKKFMPDYEIRQITKENINIIPAFTMKAMEIKNYALAGHYARVEELYKTGGIYFDIDIEAVRSFDVLVENIRHGLVLGAESKWWINNAVIISEAGHPFLKECMDYMDKFPFDNEKIELATGPIMFTNLMRKRGWDTGKAGTFKGVTVLTPPHFYPYHYDAFYTPECITEKTFCVHHWSNSWNNKVSIIIPCYNQAEFLPEAIESCLAQTYEDIEIIVVNDGSPDNTNEVVEKIRNSKNPKARSIRLIEQPNGGLSSARNTGIKKCAGGWVVTLDADDKLHHEFVEKTIGKNDIVSTRLETFGREQRTWKSRLENPTYKDLLQKNHINCCSLFKKDVWTIAGGYDEQMKDGFEDWEFWIRATKAGFNITSIDETLFYYRKHVGASMFDKAKLAQNKIMSYMRAKYPDNQFKKV